MNRNALIYHLCLNFVAAIFIAFFLTLVNTIIMVGFPANFAFLLLKGTLIGIAIGTPVASILALPFGRLTEKHYEKGSREYSMMFNALQAFFMNFVMNFFIPLINTGSIPSAKPYLDSLLISFGIIFTVGLFTEKWVFKITDYITQNLMKP
ncbi:MAG: hypothetical protein RR310_07990 [Eubacterium sp.]